MSTESSTEQEPMLAVALVWTTDERAFGQPFDGPECLERAHAFAEDVRVSGDFPGALIAVTGNQAAVDDRTERLMASLGFPDFRASELDGDA